MKNALTSAESRQIDTYQWTPEQMELIKATIAKGATNAELQLFLYRCQVLGLDPLKSGQIYFIKYNNSPGTIVIGIDGFRAKAHRTGLVAGIQRGVTKDEKGNLISAWCEVRRKDWQFTVREEVPRTEYDTGRGTWAEMPETMLKKVAEASALRMAFPDDLGGVYTEDEMDQASHHNEPPSPPQAPSKEAPLTEIKTKVRTRAVIGAEIMAAATELRISKQEVEEWAKDVAKVPPDKMSIEQMEDFLAILQGEVGSRGVIA